MEGAMSEQPARQNLRTSALHPKVYVAMAGLALWLVASVWAFSGEGYADWLLVVVSGFILAVVGLVFVLSQVGTHDPGAKRKEPSEPEKFQDWAGGEFSTWQDRVRGRNAAIEILLPLAAVAFGMTA